MKRCVEEVRRRAGTEKELASREDQRVLREFGHTKIMDESRMARRALMSEVSEEWVRGRPRLCRLNSVKAALDSRGTVVKAGRQCER